MESIYDNKIDKENIKNSKNLMNLYNQKANELISTNNKKYDNLLLIKINQTVEMIYKINVSTEELLNLVKRCNT